jgi:hypothetical protein
MTVYIRGIEECQRIVYLDSRDRCQHWVTFWGYFLGSS